MTRPAETGGESVQGGRAWLEEILGPEIADRGLTLVFPSQAVADAWALAAPGRFGLGAVETGRFIGWDRFKETVLSARRKEKPADRLARTVWAAGVVSRQGKAPFLSRITGPGKPTPAFVPYLAKLPPSLRRITRAVEAAERQGQEPARDAGLSDLLVLGRDYAAFLDAHGLFEPGWEEVEALPGDSRWLIVAPSLMEDFSAYGERLRGLDPRVRIIDLPAPGDSRPALLAFDNAFEELRWTFLEAGRLLDLGADPGDIVVTIAGLEPNVAWVERAAALAGLPVAIKAGSSLADSPFGRLLREAGEAEARGFDFDAFKPLLLDRFARWKNPDAIGDLIRFGIDYHAYASYSSGGRRVDVWKASFAAVPGTGDLRAFYERLCAALGALRAAPDFSALRTAIFAFRSSFLDESGWTGADERVVERAMVELEGLARAEAELGAAGSLESPFALYLAHLSETTYVPQSPGEGASIAVYPYRVSALHPARRHFVVGAGQDAITVAYASLPFLREDQKAALAAAQGGGSADRDASPDFAQAYALSCGPAGSPDEAGEAPEGTTFSFSTEGFEGWSIPHPFFTPPLPGATASIAPPAGFAALREACPLRAEAAAWRGEAGLPDRLLALQAEGFASARASLPRPSTDFARDKAAPSSLAAIAPRIRTADGSIRLSATSLREYLGCPFSWLLARALRLEAAQTGVGFFDALLAGEMAHDALRRTLAAMRDLGPIQASRRDAYVAAAEEALARVPSDFEAKEGPFLAPMFSAYVPMLRDRITRHIDYLVGLPGWEAGELEAGYERPYPEQGVVLQGRMDRVARRTADGAVAIVDYKKNRLPSKDDFYVAGPGQALGDFQIAAYVALCEHAGLGVAEAWYWSIESAKALRVLGEGAAKARDGYGPELAALGTAIAEVGRRITLGDFAMAAEGGAACDGCDWKPVCRARWATE